MNTCFYDGKDIFITGAGSIGTEIVKLLLKTKASSIRIFDNSEIHLHNAMKLFKHDDRVKYIFGDIRDKESLLYPMRNVEIVFHTAAMKHINICERNPADSVKTNIIGTQNIIDIALELNCEKVINISTDKAANPSSVMGATKLISEKLIMSAQYYRGKTRTIFISVRFGNVMGSSGSVLPIFKKQLDNDDALTVTDKEMTRFMMKTDDAVSLISKATEIGKGGEIFILKMPSMKIMDLAEILSDDIKIIGKTECEKIHEILMTEEESMNAYENDEMIVLCSDRLKEYYKLVGFKKINYKSYKSKDCVMSKKSIKNTFKDEL